MVAGAAIALLAMAGAELIGMSFPMQEWVRNAEGIVERLYPPGSGRDPEPVDAFRELDPELNQLIKVLARGRHYADDTVDLPTRTLCTISCLIALGAREQVQTWIANARHAGVTRDQIVAVISQLSVYVGVPRLVEGYEAARWVFAQEDAAVGPPAHNAQ
jgi:4-carboxymuconolactone decarboxylase